MGKKRNDQLIIYAEEALQQKEIGILNREDDQFGINASYDGQTAAFGVTVAMCGLLPAIAIYINDDSGGTGRRDRNEVKKSEIIKAIIYMLKTGGMIKGENDISQSCKLDCQRFLILVSSYKEKKEREPFKKLKRDILDCSIALKQVIRTYPEIENK